MTAKKKPLTKKEANRLYLIRKKEKEEAAKFEAALEAPASVKNVDVQLHVPTMTVEDVEDGDSWEPYAPKTEVPKAKGETDETAIQPGTWHAPEIPSHNRASIPESTEPPFTEEDLSLKADMPLVDEVLDLGTVASPPVAQLPEGALEQLQQAVEALEWLLKRDKHCPVKTKTIITLRTLNLRKLIKLLA